MASLSDGIRYLPIPSECQQRVDSGLIRSYDQDLKYAFRDDEHIKLLKESKLQKLGSRLNDGVLRLNVGGTLGLSNDQLCGVENTPNPGYEMLKVWREKGASTFLVLRNALLEEKREDLVKQLKKFQLNEILLSIIIKRDGLSVDELKIKCPGRKSLIDVIRPEIGRKFGARVAHGILTYNMQAQEREILWSSPSQLCEGQQITLSENCVTCQTQRVASDPLQRVRQSVVVERNVISWIQDDGICFGYQAVPEDTITTLTTHHADAHPNPAGDPADTGGLVCQCTSLPVNCILPVQVSEHSETVSCDDSGLETLGDNLTNVLNCDESFA